MARWVPPHPTPAPQAYPTAPSVDNWTAVDADWPTHDERRAPPRKRVLRPFTHSACITHSPRAPSASHVPPIAVPYPTAPSTTQPPSRRQRLANPWRKARANPQACPVAFYTFGLHHSLTASTLRLARTAHSLALAHHSFVDGRPRRRITPQLRRQLDSRRRSHGD